MTPYNWIQGVRDGPKFSKYDITQKHADALCALVEAVDRMMNPHKYRHEEKHPYRNDAKEVTAALARVLEDTE